MRRGRSRLRRRIELKLALHPRLSAIAARQFHRLYYYSPERTWQDTRWLGIPVRKCPLDLWIYQELIQRVRPDVIIESGTRFGGSTLFLANLCDLLEKGRVVSIDIDLIEGRPRHGRIEYLLGSSVDPAIVGQARASVAEGESVLVILDSDHSREHVLAELRAYADLVTPGSYMIVEDTNINGNPVRSDFGPGPMEALETFLVERSDFVVDETCEKFFVTFNPRGFLKRVTA